MVGVSHANDPENWPIALVFLEAYQEEWLQKQALLDYLQSDEGKLLAPTFAPSIARHYERQTLEGQVWWQQASATAVGVAAAIRFALREQSEPPGIGGKS